MNKTALLCLFLCCLFPARSFAGPPPVITAQPLDQTVTNGGTATFTVTVTSGTALSYQWYEDGLLFSYKNLTNQTSSTLTLTNVGDSDEGKYYVEVSNADGTVTSRKAFLSVGPNSPPVAYNDTYSTLEDVLLAIPVSGVLTNDWDLESEMTAMLVGNVSNGSLTLSTNGSFTYLPNTNFNGSDSFTYRAWDNGSPVQFIAQQNTTGGNDYSINSGTMGAQSFRHGTAGAPSYTITKVLLHLSREPTLPSANLNFNIGTGINAGALAGSSVAITPTSITNTSSGSSFQPYELVFGTPVGPLTAGTTYYLNFDSVASKKYFVERAGSSTYAGGTYYEDGGDLGKDIWFQIYSTTNSPSTNSGIATVTLNVTPVNDPPVAVNDSTNTLEDVSVTVRVLANDSDVESPLTITGTTTTNGTAVISGANVVFTPSPDFNGTAVFSYTISDGTDSDTANVTVTVTAVNDASPVANDDTYTMLEDTALTIPVAGVLANDTDVDGDPKTALLVSNVSNGNLSLNPNGSFTYTPNTNFNGSDSFTYRATDGMATGNVATVTIDVTPVNDTPFAVNDSANTLEDVSVTIPVLGNDSDVEGSPLTITDTSTTNGTAVISGTDVLFTPSTNFNGTAVFSYTISDGTISATANVTVNVILVNDAPPVANNDTYSTLEDTALTIPVAGVLANDTDVDGDPKTALLVSNVSNGSLSLNTNGSFTYTPNTNYNGTDSFTYAARDGMATGNVATVTINVTAVNDTPFAVDDGTNTLEDVSVTIQVLGNDSDVEGSPLTITGVSTTNGTAVISGPNIVFTPSTNFNGTAVFSYTISDGVNSDPATVTVMVAPVNDTPVANNDTYTRQEDLTLTVPAGGILTNDTDVEGTVLTALLVSNVTKGSLSLNANGGFTYTPNTNYNGSDSFTYRPMDGGATGNVATVTINITPVNDTPFAVDDGTNTLEDVSVTIRVLVNDSDVEGTPLTITSTSTTNGTVVISGDNIVFTPPTNFNGTVVFSYTITDGTNSDSANVTVTVTPVNDTPVANNDAYTRPEDLTLTVASPGVLGNDWDPDSPMTTLLSSNVTNGSLSLNANGGFTYTPNTNYHGSDSFTYRPTDGVATGNVATVTINITPVNDTPFALNDTTNTLEDVSVTIKVLANDSDVEGTPLTITSTSTTNGTAVISGANVVFTPATNFNGIVVFSYTITDGTNSDPASVTVTVLPVNDTPFAVNDSISTPEDVSVTIPVLVNDSDVEGTPLTITSTSTTNGTAVINGTNIVFRAFTNFNGTAVFSYTITDGTNSDSADVTVTVVPGNDAPVAYNDTYTTQEDVALIVPAAGILSNDTDVETNVLTAWLVSDVSNGTLNLNTNGSFTYTPDTNYNGTDSFTYRARDGVYPILQENTSGGSGIDVQLGQKGAQSFRHGTAGAPSYTISKIVLYLSRQVTAPDANLNFTIGTGINSGAIAGSSVAINPLSITNTSSGVSFQRYEIVYATPVGPLAAGTNYYLNLECEASNGNNMYTEYAGSSTYANGTYYDVGSDTGRDMKFAICDSTTSGTATVTINVTAVNDTPFANNDSTNTLEDVSVTVRALANDSDVEGTPLTITSTSTTNGTAVISGANIIFTPSTNFNGTAVFYYTISDSVLSATGRVTVTVAAFNDTPFAVDDSTNTLEDVSVTIPVLANDWDVEGTPLTITGTATPNGTAVISGNNVIFRAATNFNGTVVFSYTISDGSKSATANVTVMVTSVNDTPVAYNNSYTILEDMPLNVPAAGILTNDTDVDGDALTALLVSTVSKGSLMLNANGSFTYNPNTNSNGSDSFTYRANDGLISGNVATVTINVTPVNDVPFANNDSTNTLEDVSVTLKVLANDSDVEGTPLTITSTSTTNGTAVISGNNVIFRAATNFNGTVVFSYTISDGTNSDTANVTVTVTPVNDAPVAYPNLYTTPEDVPLIIPAPGVLSNDVDVDGDSLVAYLVSNVSHGSVNLNTDGSFRYTPSTNYYGSDSFTYLAADGQTIGNIVTVTINLTPVNDAPIAYDDSYTTQQDVPLIITGLGIVANDFDVDGDVLSTWRVANVSHGSLSLNPEGSFTYTPNSNFCGSDTFTYLADDGQIAGNVATVTINVVNTNAPLSFDSGAMTSTGFELKLSGPKVPSYIIEASTDLTDWTPISTNSGFTGNVVFTDTKATNFSHRFYRAMAR